MKYMTQAKLKKILAEGIHEITFTKSNGEKRVIKATRDHSYLANVLGLTSTEQKSTRPENPDVVTCMDTEINEWRSFRVDAVTAVEK